MVLVGNKYDTKEDKRQVSKEEGKKFADENEMLFFETSAKTGKNVEKLIEKSAKEISKKMKENEDLSHFENDVSDDDSDIETKKTEKSKEKKGCCCFH